MPTDPRSRARWPALALSVAALLGPGCGSADEFQRVGVSGKVTLAGKPLDSGTISFVPLQSGPSVRGTIADGSYSIARSAGPSVGTYRVEVYSIRPTGRKVADNDNPGSKMDETRNVVADRYSLRSELRAEIKQDGQQLDYAVEPRK